MFQLSDEKKERIQEAKKNCELYLDCLNQILEGQCSISDASIYLGYSQSTFYRHVNCKEEPRKVSGISKDDFFQLLKESQPPFYRLLDDLMKTSDYLIPIPESTQELFLRRIRKKLTKRRWDYIMFYYGLDGNKPLTNIEIARRFNVSRQAVSIGLIRALETIREPSNMILLFPEYEEYVKTLQQAKEYKKGRQKYEELIRKKQKKTGCFNEESKELIEMLLNGLSVERIREYLNEDGLSKGNPAIHCSLKDIPEFQPRTYNILMRNGINTMDKLCQYSIKSLAQIKGMGPMTLNDILYVLKLYGRSLRHGS